MSQLCHAHVDPRNSLRGLYHSIENPRHATCTCSNAHNSHTKMLTAAPPADHTAKRTMLAAKLQSRRPTPSSKSTTMAPRSLGSDQTVSYFSHTTGPTSPSFA